MKRLKKITKAPHRIVSDRHDRDANWHNSNTSLRYRYINWLDRDV